jgi:hypothetical protein
LQLARPILGKRSGREIDIPWWNGATGAEVHISDGDFLASTDEQQLGWEILPGQSVRLTVVLTAPDVAPIVTGVLHIAWQGKYSGAEDYVPIGAPGSLDIPSAIAPAPRVHPEKRPEPEARLFALIDALPPEKKANVLAKMTPPGPTNAQAYRPKLLGAVHLDPGAVPPTREPQPTTSDSARRQSMIEGIRALCEAYGGSVPGYPDLCGKVASTPTSSRPTSTSSGCCGKPAAVGQADSVPPLMASGIVGVCLLGRRRSRSRAR